MNIQQYLHQNLKKSTAKSYQYQIQKYQQQNKNTQQNQYKNIMQYIETLRKTQHPSTIAITLAAIKKYHEYLIKTGIRKDNPAKSIKLQDTKPKPIQLQDLLTQKELQSLLKPRQERYPILAKRNQIIISLLVHQALKVGEIIQLKTQDINLEKAQIHITATAQTNNRILALKAEQILLFYNYLEHRNHLQRKEVPPSEEFSEAFLTNKLNSPITTDDINYLISTYQKQFTKKLTTITIRQSVITNLLAKGNDLRIVQHFAGHKQLDTTEKYKETGLNALQTAIQKQHPIK